jgi:hypothetical protein
MTAPMAQILVSKYHFQKTKKKENKKEERQTPEVLGDMVDSRARAGITQNECGTSYGLRKKVLKN